MLPKGSYDSQHSPVFHSDDEYPSNTAESKDSPLKPLAKEKLTTAKRLKSEMESYCGQTGKERTGECRRGTGKDIRASVPYSLLGRLLKD
jgi:hypothetical protein